SMPSELSGNSEDPNVVTQSEKEDATVSIDQSYELLDEEADDSDKFPKPWRGDRFAILPSLLKCVRFPLMQKRFIVDKVEKNPVIMEAEGMKDLVIEAYRHHLMPDVANNHPTSRTKPRKKKTKIID
ncbi:9748_t:CDS:2, partial [Acaulospora morrowiae]